MFPAETDESRGVRLWRFERYNIIMQYIDAQLRSTRINYNIVVIDDKLLINDCANVAGKSMRVAIVLRSDAY